MEQQIKSLVNNMQSFAQESYHRDELLREELAFQTEMAKEVFGEESKGKRIWDIYERLSELNQRYKGVANESLERFKKGCSFLDNEIRGAFSGKKGEELAFKSLQTLKGRRRVLRNVELEKDGHRTELDIVVFTKKAVFIIEVKNTKRNVLIDENGNMQRYSISNNAYKFDSYLGMKMNDKEYLLRKALETSDYKNVPIVSFVVFTDSTINIENRYPFIKTCVLSSLPHLIERDEHSSRYSMDEINNMMQSVIKSQTNQRYMMPREIGQMKIDFWETILILQNQQRVILKKRSFWENIANGFKKFAAPVAATIGVLITGVLFIGKK